jgi:membrane-associated phospholipid phosphatase
MMTKKLMSILLVLALSMPLFSFSYNKDLDIAGDITSALSLATPAVLFIDAPSSDYLTIASSWGATMLTSYGMRTLLKHTIDRERPYVDQPSRPADTSEDNDSFPSGHTLMSFASAAYLQTMGSLFYPDSKTVKITAIATWTLAGSTAILRVVGGSHHLTDVVAGAAIGSTLGFLGPWITSKLAKGDPHAPTLVVGPTVGVQVAL